MTLFLVISILFAVVDWVAVALNNRQLEYLAKPITLIALCVWFASLLPGWTSTAAIAFLIGLVFSLFGDIFLMLHTRHFLKGLIAFLLAHLAYIVAFNMRGPVLNPGSFILAGVIALIALLIMRRLIASLLDRGRRSMVGPIVAYAIVLSLTLWSATTTTLRPEWSPIAALLAAIGGCLFFISDTAIAWSRFIGPHPGGRVFEMVTYHLAQYGLSVGFLLSMGAIP